MKPYHVSAIRIWKDQQGNMRKKLYADYGPHGWKELFGSMYIHQRDNIPVAFYRGGEVAMQILPSRRYPQTPYKAAEQAEGVAFGFDYVDLRGNYRAADGTLIFSGPDDPQVMERTDGTIAFSGPRNPDP